jgi:UPF0176 protein
MYLSITFYKYFDFKDVENKRFPLKDLMLKHDVKGKIIISNEGVNGAICGVENNLKEFMKDFEKFESNIKNIGIRFTKSDIQTFKRTLVKIRDELVPLGVPNITPNSSGGGAALKPLELKEMYEKEEDFIIVDARNDYEWQVGKFEGAENPNITKFRDFKEYVKTLEEFKDKKIITYCTGGIRCEKASAYMKSEGFKDVYKLDGGIIDFMRLEGSEKYWKGKLFVFDKRWEIDSKETRI